MDRGGEEIDPRPLGRGWSARVRENDDRVRAGGRRRLDRALERREELLDHERLRNDAHETGLPAARGDARSFLRERVRVGSEHENRQRGVGSPDRGGILPGPRATGAAHLAVEDHAPWVESIDRPGDLIVIGDGDRAVPGVGEERRHELAEDHIVLHEQHWRRREIDALYGHPLPFGWGASKGGLPGR